MRTQIIDLAELRGDDDFPAYAAVFSPRQCNPFVLSPAAMRWGGEIGLSRLEDCRLFWLSQKKKLRCKLSDLFEPLLRHHCGENYLAVFADHPWQCLLYLYYQIRRNGRGLYLLQSRLDQNIFKSLDWACWFAAQEALPDHWLALKAKGFNPDAFHARQAQLQRFIARIGVSCPAEMKQADANAMTRRFGKWLGLTWRWSFTDSKALQGFPWLPFEGKRTPCVSRDLEYPVNQWAYIEVLLREDFSRLGEQFRHDDCEHINRMNWEITLFNYQVMNVELSFRHPYSLHRDLPDCATALYQARYIYDDMMRRLSSREHDLDLPESMPFIGWRVSVCERIRLAPQLWDLFARELEQIDYRQILALQNKLPLAFESYRTDASFYPETSFCRTPLGTAPAHDFDTLQWSSSAANKPLFCYPEARPIDIPSRMQKVFLERNSEQWWLGEGSLKTLRDYFMLQDHRGRRSWAYRDSQGRWFKQGEFC